MKEDDADGKTFLHKSLLTRVPERRSALIFIKAMPESGGDSDTGGKKRISNIRGGANPVSLRQAAALVNKNWTRN